MSDKKKADSSSSSRRRRRKGFTSVSSVLSAVASKFGLETRMKEQAFMSMWQYVVGEPLSSLSRPVFIDYQRNLVVGVRDSAVASELSLRRKEIMASLRSLASSVGIGIAGVRFDVRHYHRSTPETGSAMLAQPQSPAIPEPSDRDLDNLALEDSYLEELAFIEASMSSSGGDEEVKKRILGIYERELRHRQWLAASGAPLCSLCGQPERRLHGGEALCTPCYVASLSRSKT
ncbi:MAG: DUF721 domain-containing protein [Candidatus Melainabacteria bacterium]|nr:DUF721 domain-containing protein [Candidatus Melainabacteria bacterium]